MPEALVFDNDTSVVASGTGARARLHDEVAGLLGALHARPVVLRPADPEAKGGVERTIGYAETSFLPLRTFASLDDLQDQHDTWAAEVAWRRHIRRLGGTVAERYAASARIWPPCPTRSPTRTSASRPGPAGTPSSGCSGSTTRSRPPSPVGGSRIR